MFWYTILSAIDNIFFTLVRDCFKIILYLADVEIFQESVINDFSKRVYMLLAVIMFFKIAVSTIQYLVDPDKLSDSNSGVGAILKNSAIAIILLVVVPEVFRFARAAQTDVASYIPALIMGDEYGTTSGQSNVQRVTKEANNMTSTVMKVFYTPKQNKSNFQHGKEIKIETFKEQITDGCDGFNLMNLGSYFSTESCSWNYTIILPVVVAGLMLFVLVSMAVDIAIRAIKFALLEIMAPIPIVSYIDKGGKGAFESWLNEVKNVYLDLFIRIAVVYFIIFIIDKVVNDFNGGIMFKHMDGESVFVKGLVLIFIIIGLLLFGKEAPKYLCDALGIKGGDKISPMFKRAGGLLGSAFGTGRDSIGGAINKYNKLKAAAGGKFDLSKPEGKKARNKALKDAALAGLRGGRSSAWAGTRAAMGGKGFKETMEASRRAADRAFDLYEARKDANVSWKDYKKEVLKNRMGIRQDLEALNAEIKAAQECSDKAKASLDWVHNNLGAKLADMHFGNDFLDRDDIKKKIAESKLNGTFTIGLGNDGQALTFSMADMGENGKYSINTIMTQLQSTVEDKDGTLAARMRKHNEESYVKAEEQKIADEEAHGATISDADKQARLNKAKQDGIDAAEMDAAQMKSSAQKMIDDLQGFADQFAVSMAGLDKNNEEHKKYMDKVGYTGNPAFERLVEEAKAAIITHSATTFGINTKETGQEKGFLDNNGDVIEGMLGDWIALNKKAGQDAQTKNIATQTSDTKVAAQAAAKEIADKYDKKS